MKKKEIVNIIQSGKENVCQKKDSNFRYQREELDLMIKRSGDTRTVFKNLGVISNSLHRRPLYLVKYLGIKLHTKHGLIGKENSKKCVGYCRGKFGKKKCESLIQEFTDKYVICPSCSNPETCLSVKERGKGKKVQNFIYLVCFACGRSNEIPVNSMHRKMRLAILKNRPIRRKEYEEKKVKKVEKEERKEIVWHTDTSPEAVRRRRMKFNSVQSDLFEFQGIGTNEKKHPVNSDGKMETRGMTPQTYLKEIIQKLVILPRIEEEEEEEMENEVRCLNDLDDAHFYYAVKEVEKEFHLSKNDIIRLICEMFLIPKLAENCRMENFISSHHSFLQHYFSKDRQHQQTCLKYLKILCRKHKSNPEFLSRISVILFLLHDKGVLEEKVLKNFFKVEGENKKANTATKIFLCASKPFEKWFNE